MKSTTGEVFHAFFKKMYTDPLWGNLRVKWGKKAILGVYSGKSFLTQKLNGELFPYFY